jgi:hypothetical protein
MKSIALSLLFLLSSFACTAQSTPQSNPPNYQDAVSWILANANQLGSSMPNATGTPGSSSSTYSNVAIKACTLTYHVEFNITTATSRKDVTMTTNEDSDFSISLSPDIKVVSIGSGHGPYNVVFSSRNPAVHESGKKTTKFSDDTTAETETLDRNQHGAAWTFGKPNSDHKEVATHMVQALNSIADLCGKSK